MQGLHSSLSAFALLHSSFVLLNYKISCHVAKIFQMKSATLQVVSEGRMQGLHSSFERLCIVAFFFFCQKPCPETRFFTEGVMLNRQKKKNQPSKINRVRMKITTCIIAFFLFCPDSSPVNALCHILLRNGDTYPSD